VCIDAGGVREAIYEIAESLAQRGYLHLERRTTVNAVSTLVISAAISSDSARSRRVLWRTRLRICESSQIARSKTSDSVNPDTVDAGLSIAASA
jgi:hypothetical protein